MPYEQDKDKVIVDFGQIEGTDLHATLRSYNGGPEKISIVSQPQGTGRPRQLLREKPADLVSFAYWLVATYDPDGSRKPQAGSESPSATKAGVKQPSNSGTPPQGSQGQKKAVTKKEKTSAPTSSNVVPIRGTPQK